MRRHPVTLVAHTIHDTGGMERAFSQLIRGLSDEVEFEVFAGHLQDDLLSAVRWRRVHVPRRPVPFVLAAFAALVEPHLRRRDCIVHTQGAITVGRPDVASVQFCHAAFQQLPADQQHVAGGRARRVNRAVDQRLSLAFERRIFAAKAPPVLLPASSGVESELRAEYPSARSRVVPNGVDLVRFSPPGRAEPRSGPSDGTPDLVALFVGGDWQRKGLPLVVEALGRLRGEAPKLDVRLVVVGGGDPEPLKARARATGVEHAVTFVGRVGDPERYYRAADVFVFPTAYEAFPLVALEAAASGLPILATRANGITDLVDETAGVLIQRRVEDIASSLRKMAEDPALRDRLGEGARRRAERYSWDAANRRVLQCYEELS